ncbi:MAG: fasciclin domain-containing protein [Ilumatobacteraceae bacterium]|jgi:LPXTG-motif cell wall-anchored protein|nr:fasciclin domain-containing protein [Acidimicrobiaceae bacterium]MBP6486144.1 fasciclin domain-containing protein [Ilumatobacteraceae bacterium]MBK9970122.1 fasciclin domain-containing protein [Acidimicrobiaceae bacterium]MBP7888997.1 fasciclin domain-containing protein [Ilumatobacteraceae bacterium]MBP8208345.1 fasciclin domain-containing protein [Ilumatobacteraceae bacterium]
MKKKLVLLVAAAAASVLPMTASASAAPAAGDPTKTIAEQASADPQFSTLVAALGAADLVGPFDACTDAKTTVFAPTNDAFAAALTALGMTADQLLADTELLTSVLTYHVVSGAVDAATVVGLTEATTLNGAKISIKVVDGTVLLNDTVKVTTTDIQACNGIIHVIDAVLLPPAAPTAPTGEMPATGAASDTLVMGAAALLLGGAGALLISRRRRPVNA